MVGSQALEEPEAGADDVEGAVAVEQPLARRVADDGAEAEVAIPRFFLRRMAGREGA